MSIDNTSREKTVERQEEKKPYKTPSLRFEPVFEVSALSCGKTPGVSGACSASKKVS